MTSHTHEATVVPPDVWPEPAISRLGPRPVRLTEETNQVVAFWRIFSIAVVAIGLPIVLAGAKHRERFTTEGVVLWATVEERKETKGDDNPYMLVYRYRLAGQEVSKRAYVRRREYELHPIGSQVQVTALSSEPRTHRYGLVAEDEGRIYQAQGSAIVGIAALVIGLFGFANRYMGLRDRRILRTWPAEAAQILSIETEKKEDSPTVYKIHYRIPIVGGYFSDVASTYSRYEEISLRPGDFLTVLKSPAGDEQDIPLFMITGAEIQPAP